MATAEAAGARERGVGVVQRVGADEVVAEMQGTPAGLTAIRAEFRVDSVADVSA